MTSAAIFASSAAVNFVSAHEVGHIVLFGGGPDRDGYTSETWLYDPTTDRWTEAPAAGTRASLTLTSEGCAYQGPMQFTAAELSVSALNETTDGGNFEILRLGSDRSYEELAALFEDVQRAVDEGTPEPPQPPGLYTEVRRLWVDAGEEGELAGSVRAGTHAFLCGQISGEPMELLRVTVRGPIEITE